jgi:hypothetical protein
MTIHGNNNLLAVDTQFFAGGFNDANVRLMRNQPINVTGLYTRYLANLFGDTSARTRTANLNTAWPIHTQEGSPVT